MKKTRTGLIILLIATIMLAACAPAATPAPEAAPTQAPAAPATEAPTVAPEPTAAEAAPTEAMPETMEPVTFETGMSAKMVLLPKFLGILVFDQANQGAEEAAAELGNPEPLEFLGPTPENSVAGQIEIVTNATTQGVDGIMLSNNAGDQIVPAATAAEEAGVTVVTWDSPDPHRRRRAGLRRPGRLQRDRRRHGRHGPQHPGRGRRPVRGPLRFT